MTDLRDRLAPLRELQPTPAEHARVLVAPSRRPRRRPAIAVAIVAAAALAALAIPAGRDAARAPLAAAAAAAAEQPGPAGFTGYRYVDVVDRRTSPWSLPEQACFERAVAGSGGPIDCPAVAEVEFTALGREELWVDARWHGVRRDHGSRVTEVSGDPELAAAVRRDLRREPATRRYVYGDGPFSAVPLERLPTDPAALLRALSDAYADGRWSEGGRFRPSESAREFEFARFIAHLLAEANATPALRAAAFGVLERMPGVRDLGAVRDARGRRGHGIEVRGTAGPPEQPVAGVLTVVFDAAAGDVLEWGERTGEQRVVRTILRTAHVRAIPAGVEVDAR